MVLQEEGERQPFTILTGWYKEEEKQVHYELRTVSE